MRIAPLVLAATLALCAGPLRAQTSAPAKNGPAEEHAPDGKLLAKGAYKDGLKTGKWTTFHDNGKPADDAVYLNGKLAGTRTFYWPNGKTRATVPYRDGAVSGQVLTFDDTGKRLLLLNYPRPLPAIQKAWSELYPYEPLKPVYDTEPSLAPPYKAGVLKKEVTDQALKFVKLYRFLANQPYENIAVDPSLNALCSAGSVLLHKHGSLNHFPPKPADMADQFFAIGAEGCAHSNIYTNTASNTTVIDSIRAYMDDSDNSNVGKVGHRQWIINPKMTKTGFGFASGFSETYAHGQAVNMQIAERYHVFPGEGYYPEQLVEAHYAWSVHYNPAQVTMKRSDVKVTIQRLADDFSVAEEIPTEIVAVFAEGNWPTPTLIFRPKWARFTPARYAVSVTNILTKNNDNVITYVVDLVSMADVKQAVPATRPAQSTRPAPAAARPKP